MKRGFQKRSFVLLEGLIALSLVVIFGVFFITQPFHAYKTELRLFKEAEKERLADWAFSEVKEKLIRKEIFLTKANGSSKSKEVYRLSDTWIELLGQKKVKLERSFTLVEKEEKEDPQGKIFRWVTVTISLKDIKTSKYRYHLVIS